MRFKCDNEGCINEVMIGEWYCSQNCMNKHQEKKRSKSPLSILQEKYQAKNLPELENKLMNKFINKKKKKG